MTIRPMHVRFHNELDFPQPFEYIIDNDWGGCLIGLDILGGKEDLLFYSLLSISTQFFNMF